ncbi:hypothetical protein SAMN05216334_10342 [Nitrosomonas ureae]|uniref:Uncharacterized protein n=1 Tax=Nitrosomonas ureae TaxID=44577 RepID=A0A1H5SRL2_9PROT|nr:hypothetical protein SAMN05216334_10342 [Nitrosomonas ureae]
MEIFGVLLNGYDDCASVVSSEGASLLSDLKSVSKYAVFYGKMRSA